MRFFSVDAVVGLDIAQERLEEIHMTAFYVLRLKTYRPHGVGYSPHFVPQAMLGELAGVSGWRVFRR